MNNSSHIQLQPGDALIIVDVQNDFLPGGSLPVPGGNAVVPVINQYINKFTQLNLPVYATRDWHPANHCSFSTQGGRWPPHCIANSYGAEFAADLNLPNTVIVISKATKQDTDAYSGFHNTGLNTHLNSNDITQLYIAGLATDYCVLNTVKDALQLKFKTYLLQDAIRAVNIHPDDGDNAINEMKQMGAILINQNKVTV